MGAEYPPPSGEGDREAVEGAGHGLAPYHPVSTVLVSTVWPPAGTGTDQPRV
jgi:hypothetical protein